MDYISWMIFPRSKTKASGSDQASIGGLYDSYAPWLLGICLQYMGNREDAEDVLHDGFMKIILNIGKFKERQPGSLEAWMRKIMVNTALKYIRDHKKEKRTVDMFPALEVQDGTDDRDDFSGCDFSKDQLMNMIRELPSGYRTVFNLYVMDNYSHKEIGKMLGISENTSKSQLSKARSFLRKRLNEYQNEMNYARAESSR